MPILAIGESSTTSSMINPSCDGSIVPMNPIENMDAHTKATTILAIGPAAKTLALFFFPTFSSSSSSGSVKAPSGTMKNNNPNDLTFIFPTLASIP